MKRDWNVIKAALQDLELLNSVEGRSIGVYYTGDKKSPDEDIHKFEMIILLLDQGFIKGHKSKTIGTEFRSLLDLNLTWKGHDLLDTLNDNKLWKKIKEIALNKGIDLTFTSLGILTPMALASL